MQKARKPIVPVLSSLLDLPFLIAALLTVIYYMVICTEAMQDSLLHHYTAEHLVEYAIIAFFFWGLVDVAFKACLLPREMLALRHDFLPPANTREPATAAAGLLATLKRLPLPLQRSRVGERLAMALEHLVEKGSADDFTEHLRYLADQDYEKTQSRYGLLRFICWVTPMFGFLGTVVHFGTALGGQGSHDLSERLPTVVAEMGTAFNTTTVALTAATTMMFSLFLCERSERKLLLSIDHRADRLLQNRFQVADATMVPYLAALEATSRAMLETMNATIQQQLASWAGAVQAVQQQGERQQQIAAEAWLSALDRLETRFETNDAQRERHIVQLLDKVEQNQQQNRRELTASADLMASVRGDFSKLVEAMAAAVRGEGDLLRLQASLAENVRLLRDTQQLDQAFHGLTAAIHMLTARNPGVIPSSRAA